MRQPLCTVRGGGGRLDGCHASAHEWVGQGLRPAALHKQVCRGRGGAARAACWLFRTACDYVCVPRKALRCDAAPRHTNSVHKMGMSSRWLVAPASLWPCRTLQWSGLCASSSCKACTRSLRRRRRQRRRKRRRHTQLRAISARLAGTSAQLVPSRILTTPRRRNSSRLGRPCHYGRVKSLSRRRRDGHARRPVLGAGCE